MSGAAPVAQRFSEELDEALGVKKNRGLRHRIGVGHDPSCVLVRLLHGFNPKLRLR